MTDDKPKKAVDNLEDKINDQGVETNALNHAGKSNGESFGTMNSNSSLSYSLIGGRKKRRRRKSKSKKRSKSRRRKRRKTKKKSRKGRKKKRKTRRRKRRR